MTRATTGSSETPATTSSRRPRPATTCWPEATFGQAGGDDLSGNAGPDRLVGVTGVDAINGGGGADICHGGEQLRNCES